jgi:hypothetical protein
MKVEITGLGKLDAIELERLLGKSAVRSEEPKASADGLRELGTAALIVLLLSPPIIAGVIAWASKPRRRNRTRLKFRSTADNGAVEEFELDSTSLEEDGLTPQALEKIASMTKLPVSALKAAIKEQLEKGKSKKDD